MACRNSTPIICTIILWERSCGRRGKIHSDRGKLVTKNKAKCVRVYVCLNFEKVLLHRRTSVEPVNAILLTSGWSTSAAPAVGPKPGTTFTTPGGNPAYTGNRTADI